MKSAPPAFRARLWSSLERTALSGLAAAILIPAAALAEASREIGADIVDQLPPAVPKAEFVQESADSDGWGWYWTETDRRDIGIAFRSAEDTEFRQILLKIQRVPEGFLEESPFIVEIFETGNLDEDPTKGRKIYSGEGRINLRPEDSGRFLALELGRDLPIRSGSVYTLVFAWKSPASFNTIAFETQPGFSAGRLWFRQGPETPAFTVITDGTRPGILFAIF